MKTKEDWWDEFYPAEKNMNGMSKELIAVFKAQFMANMDKVLRETWQSATKAQIRRDKFKMLGHTMSMQVSESGDELVNFPGDPT